jgi:hypothetical protein
MLCVLMLGCGGTTFHGSVDGETLSPKSAIFSLDTSDNGSGGTSQLVQVLISDQSDLCKLLQTGVAPKNSSQLGIKFYGVVTNGAFGAVATGKYEVVTSISQLTGDKAASGYFQRSDDQCLSTLTEDQGTAVSGTAELDSFKAEASGTSSGSFNLNFPGTDVVSGGFDATYCDLSKLPNPSCAD